MKYKANLREYFGWAALPRPASPHLTTLERMARREQLARWNIIQRAVNGRRLLRRIRHNMRSRGLNVRLMSNRYTKILPPDKKI